MGYFIVLVSLLLSSCMSVTPHQVTFTSAPMMKQETVGQGQPLFLSVVDARTEKRVGLRSGPIGASITAPGLISHLKQQVAHGLEAKGFVVVQEKASRQVTVSLTRFAWGMRGPSLVAQVGAMVDITVEARSTFTPSLRRVYSHDYHPPTLITPMADEVDRILNTSLAHVLSQFFADTRFFTELAKLDG